MIMKSAEYHQSTSFRIQHVPKLSLNKVCNFGLKSMIALFLARVVMALLKIYKNAINSRLFCLLNKKTRAIKTMNSLFKQNTTKTALKSSL